MAKQSTKHEEINIAAGIEYLKNTKDAMLIELAEAIEKNGTLPNEDELVTLLVFFLTFSIGCTDLKIPEVAQKFNDRAEYFVTALGKWGMHSGKYRDVVKKRWEPVTYNKIMNKALAKAAYNRAGSVNKY